ncbi:MAG: ABC transporter ATP-binding protein [Phycisphaerales bacterium]|nr:ABC transporter ATP-binding protein [Phycisphaerales bacterium]
MSCEPHNPVPARPHPPRASTAVLPSASATSDHAVAISARDISKRYQMYAKPRDRLKQAVVGRWRTYYSPFYALRNINFELMRGEALGIVGRNGSGKSTLLQIIAGTLTPTEGEVRVHGRIAALLELGSGFDPEFTGRENVFLNGAILGVARKEMEERFDDIAAFADIGNFIDQPVKHYSSGMYARLAFSVAVSVKPDILIVDEILAVGDMGFQQKCVARMRKLLDTGLTLLYVSHSPDSVKSLCQKGLFLRDGEQVCYSSSELAVDRYFNYVRDTVNAEAQKAQPELANKIEAKKTDVAGDIRYGTGQAQIEQVRLIDSRDRVAEAFKFGEEIIVEVRLKALIDLINLDVHFHVRDAVGVDLFGTGTADEGTWFPKIESGTSTVVRFRFQNNLRVGTYGVTITLTRLPDRADVGGITLDHISAVAAFAVIGEPTRPVAYKFHEPVKVTWDSVSPYQSTLATPTPAITL